MALRKGILLPPGVLAPNARLRYKVIALGRQQGGVEESTSEQLDAQSAVGSSDGATPGQCTSSRCTALIAAARKGGGVNEM